MGTKPLPRAPRGRSDPLGGGPPRDIDDDATGDELEDDAGEEGPGRDIVRPS